MFFSVIILNFFIMGSLLHRDVQPVEAQAVEPSIEPEKPKPKSKPKPERKKYALPSKGITVPGTKTYRRSSSGIRSNGTLRSYYFKCIVLSEIVSGGKVYYLIRLNEPSIQSDVFIVGENGVFILEPLQSQDQRQIQNYNWRSQNYRRRL